MIKSDMGSVTLIGPATLIDAELMCASKAVYQALSRIGEKGFADRRMRAIFEEATRAEVPETQKENENSSEEEHDACRCERCECCGKRNIVQVLHEERYNNERYSFEVPAGVHLKKGDVVLVDTSMGDKIAHCVTDSAMMSDEMISMMMNGKDVTKKVRGKFEYKAFEDTEGDE